MASRFSLRTRSHFTVEQIKNRVNCLKAEYRAGAQADEETSNDTADPPVRPAYWDTLVEQFEVSLCIISSLFAFNN